MKATIVGLSEDFSFAKGESVHYISVALPGIPVFRAVVTSEVSEMVATTFARLRNGELDAVHPALLGVAVAAQQQPLPAAHSEDLGMMRNAAEVVDGEEIVNGDYSVGLPMDDVGNVIFGEDAPGNTELRKTLDRGAAAAEEAINATDMRQKTSASTQTSMPAPGWRNSARPTVTRDAFGYPVTSGAGYQDPRQVVGGEPEDGDVGQI